MKLYFINSHVPSCIFSPNLFCYIMYFYVIKMITQFMMLLFLYSGHVIYISFGPVRAISALYRAIFAVNG